MTPLTQGGARNDAPNAGGRTAISQSSGVSGFTFVTLICVSDDKSPNPLGSAGSLS